jgi:hypothetical protein
MEQFGYKCAIGPMQYAVEFLTELLVFGIVAHFFIPMIAGISCQAPSFGAGRKPIVLRSSNAADITTYAILP